LRRHPPRGLETWSDYYEYRLKRGEDRGLTRSQSRGHPGKGQKLASKVERDVTLLSSRGPTETTTVGVRDLSRASRFDNDSQLLLGGKLTPKQFDRRWAGKTIAGQELPNAKQVIALGQQGLAQFDDFYPRQP